MQVASTTARWLDFTPHETGRELRWDVDLLPDLEGWEGDALWLTNDL